MRRIPFPARRFYRRRLLYILVPYLVWSLFYWVYGRLVHPETGPKSVQEALLALFTGEVYYHLYFIVVMVQFYLLLPLLIRAFRRFGGLTVVSFSFLVSLAAVSTTWWEVKTLLPRARHPTRKIRSGSSPSGSFTFVWGDGWDFASGRSGNWLRRVPVAAVLLFFVATGLLVLIDAFLRKQTGFFQVSVITYSVASLLLWFRLAERWPDSWIALFGRHSFGLYLIHPFVLNLLSQFAPGFFRTGFLGRICLYARLCDRPFLRSVGAAPPASLQPPVDGQVKEKWEGRDGPLTSAGDAGP